MNNIRLLAALAVLLLAGPARAEPVCRETTEAYEAMTWTELRLPTRTVGAKLADSSWTRQAGMQWLCPDRIAAAPMLFLLHGRYRPGFHMNNVFAPLDIAFLDQTGTVLEIRLMRPGEQLTARYPSSAALEAAAGSFQAWGLKVGDRIEWPADLQGRP